MNYLKFISVSLALLSLIELSLQDDMILSRKKRLFGGGGWCCDNIGNGVNNVVNNVGNAVNNAVDNANNAVNNAANSVNNAVNNAVDNVNNGINQAGNSINQAASVVSISNLVSFYHDAISQTDKFLVDFDKNVIQAGADDTKKFVQKAQDQIEDVKENFPTAIFKPFLQLYKKCTLPTSTSDAIDCVSVVFPDAATCAQAFTSSKTTTQCISAFVPGFEECSNALLNNGDVGSCVEKFFPVKDCAKALTDTSKRNVQQCAAALDRGRLGFASCVNFLTDGGPAAFLDHSVDQEQLTSDTVNCGALVVNAFVPGAGQIIKSAYACRNAVKSGLGGSSPEQLASSSDVQSCAKEILNSIEPGLGASVDIVANCHSLVEGKANSDDVSKCAKSAMTLVPDDLISPEEMDQLTDYIDYANMAVKCAHIDPSNAQQVQDCAAKVIGAFNPDLNDTLSVLNDCLRLVESSNQDDLTKCAGYLGDLILTDLNVTNVVNNCGKLTSSSTDKDYLQCGAYLSTLVNSNMTDLLSHIASCIKNKGNNAEECIQQLTTALDLNYTLPSIPLTECLNAGNLIKSDEKVKQCYDKLISDAGSLYAPYVSDLVKCSNVTQGDPSYTKCLNLLNNVASGLLSKFNMANYVNCQKNHNGTVPGCMLNAYTGVNAYLNDIKGSVQSVVNQVNYKLTGVYDMLDSQYETLKSNMDNVLNVQLDAQSYYASLNETYTQLTYFIDELKPKATFETLVQSLQDGKDQLEQFMNESSNFKDLLSNQVASTLNNLTSLTTNLPTLLKEQQTQFTSLLTNVKNQLKNVSVDIRKNITNKINKLNGDFTNFTKQINSQVTVLRNIPGQYKRLINTKVTGLMNSVSSSVDQLYKSINNFQILCDCNAGKIKANLGSIQKQMSTARTSILADFNKINQSLQDTMNNLNQLIVNRAGLIKNTLDWLN